MWPAGLVSPSRDGLATATEVLPEFVVAVRDRPDCGAIHNASTTAVAVLSGDACSGKPPFTGHCCGTGICESPGQS